MASRAGLDPLARASRNSIDGRTRLEAFEDPGDQIHGMSTATESKHNCLSVAPNCRCGVAISEVFRDSSHEAVRGNISATPARFLSPQDREQIDIAVRSDCCRATVASDSDNRSYSE
jgi:hypothetical protein